MEQKQTLTRKHFLRHADTLYYDRGCAQLYGTARQEKLLISAKTDAAFKQQKNGMLPLGRLRLCYSGLRGLPQAGVQTCRGNASPDRQVLMYRMESSGMFRVFIGADSPHSAQLMLDDGLNLVGTIPQADGKTDFCLRMQFETDGTVAHSQTRILIKRATYVTLLFTSVLCANDGWEAACAQCKWILEGENKQNR